MRKPTLVEAERLTARPDDDPRWIDKKTKAALAKLVMHRKDLAAAGGKNNWFDQFETSVDLRPRVLKRLLDHFPQHAGAYARRPDRLVRLYFSYRGHNPGGVTTGTFVNAGNGPAVDIVCGRQTGGADKTWHTQGGVAVEADLEGRDHGPLAFACPPKRTDLRLFCEYANSTGDRFRVEAPLKWTEAGYVREGPEGFFVWVGSPAGGWMKA